MIAIRDFLESSQTNNAIVQMALREVDTRDVALAMLGYTEEEQQIILRNMSKRASKLLLQEMDDEREHTPKHRIQSALEVFLQRLRKHARYLAKHDAQANEKFGQKTIAADARHPELPDIGVDDEEGIVATFTAFQLFIKKHGMLALEGLAEQITDPVMRKGIEYLIDGWEPLLMQSILETCKKAYLERIEKRLDMILEGLDSLAARDIPLVTEERLRAYLA